MGEAQILQEGFDFNQPDGIGISGAGELAANMAHELAAKEIIIGELVDLINSDECIIWCNGDYIEQCSNVNAETLDSIFEINIRDNSISDKTAAESSEGKYKSTTEVLFKSISGFKEFERRCGKFSINKFKNFKIIVHGHGEQSIKLAPNFKYHQICLNDLKIEEIPDSVSAGCFELRKCCIPDNKKINVYADDLCLIYGCYDMKSYGFVKQSSEVRIILQPYYNTRGVEIPKTQSFKGLPEGIRLLVFDAGDGVLKHCEKVMKCAGIPESVKTLKINIGRENLENFDFKDLDPEKYTDAFQFTADDLSNAFYSVDSMRINHEISKRAVKMMQSLRIYKIMYWGSAGISHQKRDKLQKMQYDEKPMSESFDFQKAESASRIEEEFKTQFNKFVSNKPYCPIIAVDDDYTEQISDIPDLFAEIVGGTLKIASERHLYLDLAFRRMDDFAEFSNILAECCVYKVKNTVVLKPAGVIGHSTKDDLKARVIEHTSCLVKFQTIRCDGAVFGDCQLSCGLFDTRNSTVSIGPNAKIQADEIYYTGTLMNLSGPTGIDNISATELTINTRGGVILPPVVNKLEISLPKGLKTLNVELVNGKVNAENLQIRVLKPLSEINVKIEKSETAPIGLEFDDFEPEYIQGEIEFNLEDENTGKKVQIKKSDKDDKLAEKVNEIKNILTTYKKGIS